MVDHSRVQLPVPSLQWVGQCGIMVNKELQAMTLQDYTDREDGEKTPDMLGNLSQGAGELVFVVHEHHARHHHYDLRLEHEGALASWAVPKGVPEFPGTRHLAVRTEDHPLAYADFEGNIPEDEYGAGDVRVWDRAPLP